MYTNYHKHIKQWTTEAFRSGLLNNKGVSNEDLTSYDQLIFINSLNIHKGYYLLLIKINNNKMLLVVGDKSLGFSGYKYSSKGLSLRFCLLNYKNSKCLRKLFPFTAPSVLKKDGPTFGMGDRLGIASPGHINSIKKYKAVPILAQQSLRELKLTNRTYRDVIDASSWAVFQEGYRSPWGADGDHLKSIYWVKKALKMGCTMITADLSEHLNMEILNLSESEIVAEYKKLNENIRSKFESEYLNMKITLDSNEEIVFSINDLAYSVLLYYNAIKYAVRMYKKINSGGYECNFEISIDETGIPTTYHSHVFIAKELQKYEVDIFSIAPRFTGEFQKGIDYIGNIYEFEKSIKTHSAIARYFNHKISIHSGSDKFSIFPLVGKYSQKLFHVKTSGTSWLEALRVIAQIDSEVFIQIHQLSVKALPETKKNYHITPDLKNITNLKNLENNNFQITLDNTNDRRILHVAYGEILENKQLSRKLYSILEKNIKLYWEVLEKHMDKHLDLLDVEQTEFLYVDNLIAP